MTIFFWKRQDSLAVSLRFTSDLASYLLLLEKIREKKNTSLALIINIILLILFIIYVRDILFGLPRPRKCHPFNPNKSLLSHQSNQKNMCFVQPAISQLPIQCARE